MKFYIVWHDYDGQYVDEFEERGFLLRLYQIQGRVERKEYGTEIDLVIHGVKLNEFAKTIALFQQAE
jgi:hypothetical protein